MRFLLSLLVARLQCWWRLRKAIRSEHIQGYIVCCGQYKIIMASGAVRCWYGPWELLRSRLLSESPTQSTLDGAMWEFQESEGETAKTFVAWDRAAPGSNDYSVKMTYKPMENGGIEIVSEEFFKPGEEQEG